MAVDVGFDRANSTAHLMNSATQQMFRNCCYRNLKNGPVQIASGSFALVGNRKTVSNAAWKINKTRSEFGKICFRLGDFREN